MAKRHLWNMKNALTLMVLINCHIIQVSGVLEWTVIGKVTDYGQNVTLFCNVPNCCPKDAGWDRWTPVQQTLFIDIKTGRPNQKYDGKVLKDGYTLIIQNLTEKDLNVSYSCLYGVTIGESKFLLEEDVFSYIVTTHPNSQPDGQIAGLIVGVIVIVIVVVAVALAIAQFVYSWRRRRKGKFDYQVVKEVEEDKNPTKKDRSYIECNEGECVIFTYDARNENQSVKWLKAGRKNVENEHWKVSDGDGQFKFELTNTKKSDEGEYRVQVGKLIRKRFHLNIKEISMDSTERNKRLERIKSGREIRKYVRIQVIGKEGVGKTSLVRRLLNKDFGKPLPVLKSTNGIEIDTNCQINTSNGEWVFDKVTEKQAMIKRIKRIMQDENMKEKESETEVGQHCPFEENLSGKETHSEPNIPNTELSGTKGKEHKSLSPDEQIDMEEEFKLESEINDKHVMKHKDIVSVDEHMKEKESETDVGQHCPFEENLSGKETHNEPNIPNTELSGTKGKKHKSLSPDEQIDIEEEFKLESEINDKHVMKHKDIVSVGPNINLDKHEAYSTEPRTTKKSNEDIQHHINITPSIVTFPEKKNTFNDKTRDTKPKLILQKMDEIILEAKERENISENLDGFVECGIWDFAGQKEYYGTHQTFFTQQAVYILVADIATAAEDSNHNNDFDSIGKYIDFWFDSIHCFCTNSCDDHLCPPIFMVFTGVDKKEEFESEVSNLGQELLTFSDRKGGHLRGIYYISNTRFDQRDSEECNRLKKDISEYSNENTYFVELSTEWIQLENTLEAIKDSREEIHFLSYGEMQELASKILINERNKLNAFLTYQHTIGNMIYFEDIGEFIILKPRWLVECFRCLIFDSKKRDFKVMNDSAWTTLTGTGKISTKLIKKLLQKVTGLNKNEEFILKVMEKFNIIIKPKIKSTGRNQKTDSYYIPCMIANETDVNSIKKHFINDECKVTPWLVLEFTFLPLAYFYHILFYYIGKYEVCTIDRHPAIYKGKAVFIYDEFKRFILCLSYNSISLQIWAWDDINEHTYIDSLNELCDCIEDIKGKFSQNLSYSIKAKCRHGDISKIDGRIGWKDRNEKEKYMCNDHNQMHTKQDEDLENTWLMHAKKREEINKEKTRILTNATEEEQHSALKEKIKKVETELGEVIPYNIREEEETHSALKEKIKILETALEEVIPYNIRELIQKQIQDWEKQDKMFVSTRASDYVMECLQDNSCVTLTAPAGVGKSFIARHTALVLQKEGYNIIPVELPADIKTYYQPGKKTVFIVDDICGNFTANQEQIERWKQLLPIIDRVIADKCCKIIVSCRLQVYKDDKFKILTPFKSCECNLVSDELCLTSDEKTKIAKIYGSTNVKEISDLLQTSDFFPLLCSLNRESQNADMKEFCTNPFDVYKRELDTLHDYGDEGNYKICSLALCVLFNNDLKEKWFQGKLTDEQQQVVKDTCEACEINSNTPKAKLKKALDTLDGTFICKQNGIYRTKHDKLFDFLAHYFGQKMIECLIDHGDSGLVHKHFSWQKSPNDKTSRIDFIIEIPDDCLESYFQRFIKDWLAGKVAVVFSNNNMKVSSFRQQLIQYLLQLDKSHQVTLANTRNTVIPKGECGSGTTPLICSCHDGYTDMVQWILHNDGDVDQCRNDGTTGLIMACSHGHTEIVKLLLEKNPNVDLWDHAGSSSMHKASQNGHTEIVKLLLETNDNVNLCDKDGCSPLYMASKDGHTDIVKLLLERHPDVDKCANNECSPLDIASQNGHTDIVKLLSRKSN